MWSPKQKKMWSRRLKNVQSKIAFGQLILRKIIKTVATRCQILRLKCTKIQNSAGATPQNGPDPAGELRALPRPIAGFKGPTSKGVEGTGLDRRGSRGVLWSPKKNLKIDPATESTMPTSYNSVLQSLQCLVFVDFSRYNMGRTKAVSRRN